MKKRRTISERQLPMMMVVSIRSSRYLMTWLDLLPRHWEVIRCHQMTKMNNWRNSETLKQCELNIVGLHIEKNAFAVIEQYWNSVSNKMKQIASSDFDCKASE
jgi:hypothetical protein